MDSYPSCKQGNSEHKPTHSHTDMAYLQGSDHPGRLRINPPEGGPSARTRETWIVNVVRKYGRSRRAAIGETTYCLWKTFTRKYL